MIYLDTSFLLPLFRQEAVSERIGSALAARPRGSLAISHWTRVEFTSVIAREVRIKALGEVSARKLIDEFDSLADESFHMLIPTIADFALARDFVADFATRLRGSDALHLAGYLFSRPLSRRDFMQWLGDYQGQKRATAGQPA